MKILRYLKIFIGIYFYAILLEKKLFKIPYWYWKFTFKLVIWMLEWQEKGEKKK